MNTSQAAFEEFIRGLPEAFPVRFEDGKYWHSGVQGRWESWQAAMRQAVPDTHVVVRSSLIHCANHMADCADRFQTALNAVVAAQDAIDAADTGAELTAAERALEVAEETRSDLWSALACSVYEYRKRIEPAGQVKEQSE